MLNQLKNDLEDSQSDFKAETKRRMELELDCDLLKKGIAEKELLLIKSRQLRPRKESTAESLRKCCQIREVGQSSLGSKSSS